MLMRWQKSEVEMPLYPRRRIGRFMADIFAGHFRGFGRFHVHVHYIAQNTFRAPR